MTTFISYSRTDSEFAIRFARDLKNAGFGVWLDQLDIPKGSRWDDEVERALEAASTFIIVLSPESIESQNVKDEIGYAIDDGKYILPILLKSCKIPFRLRRFQFVDFADRPYDEGLAEIKHLLSNNKELSTAPGIERDFQQAEIQPSSELPKPIAVKPHRRWDTQVIIALIGLAGTIIAGLLGSPLFEKLFASESQPTAIATATFGNNQISNTQEAVDINTASLATQTVNPTLTSLEVHSPTLYPSEGIYNFTDHVCEASWSSGAGELPCPGIDGDAKGFVLELSNPRVESGETDSRPSILTFPQSITNGFVQGFFPPFTVQAGDRFLTTISCESGASSCYVAYRLDYQIGTDPIKTLWVFRQKYEGLSYSANLDLGSLAGQTVKFILYISAWGSPIGDRALWIAPSIVNAGCTNRAQFIADITVPDGTRFSPGEKFTKTMRFKNVGTCTWHKDYALVFDSGNIMNGPQRAEFPLNVAPGQTVDISINLQAPLTPGRYISYWKFSDPSGGAFGIGFNANKPTWVEINVFVQPTATP
jgi:TIR domain/Ig-like domain from next to BRCA1 gene